jgi:3'(2'), 5'-bisphosphate nucleotidase
MRQAGAEILRIKTGGVEADYKADASPVTQADHASEAILKAALAQFFPDIPVISEENTESHLLSPAASYFLVDPLDGTREFIRRDSNGHFTVNIGFIQQGMACGGIIYVPAMDWLCWTDKNGQAHHERDGQHSLLQIRQVPKKGPAALASRSHRDPKTNAFLKAEAITDIVSAGSSLKFLLLAAGMADIYPRFGPTMEWDTAAGEAILRGAGGHIHTPDGQPHHYGKPGWKNGAFIAYAGYRPAFPLARY